MKLEPLTMEVYHRLIQDGYKSFRIKQKYDRAAYGTNSNITMLEALKNDTGKGEDLLSPARVTELIQREPDNYCVMIV
ncbi:MAG: hypothetical protein BGO69_00625 [Bacteroidetes bacterium 46-16]|nr:MAG: hypothetical protein BGO69_00625 [Bacteroidetes bacterium 46-16]